VRWLFHFRRGYARRGVPWNSVAVGAFCGATQKQVERSVEKLVREGLVKRRSRSELLLTDAGDELARALAGLPRLKAAVPLLEQLVVDRSDPRGYDQGDEAWMPETAYAKVEWGDNARRGEFVKLEERMLPLLTRDLVKSNATAAGHVWYAPTPQGIDWLDRRPSLPKVTNVKSDDELRSLYYARVKASLGSITGSGPEPRDIGQIPMPMSILPRGLARHS
jgi:hypothetical protein